eukprot:TRINITY_DN4587_c0_g3_i2.p1 TRINITY_DN4587_c0_g3~~TRINITY_DN4587_c0_g3_i2.p1  ORF type:complete len:730 (+),score=193.42 TRINITY_DN4587_c0_g3_i2:179-2368(+)
MSEGTNNNPNSEGMNEEDDQNTTEIAPEITKRKGFQWDSSSFRCSPSIEVSDDGTCAFRPATCGKNPAVLSTEPLSLERTHFRVQVNNLGSWIGIGVADEEFLVDGAAVLGSQIPTSNQIPSINSSYFCQTSTKIRIAGGKTKKASRITSNDVVDVAVDYEASSRKLKFFYWLNETLQGCVDVFIEPYITARKNKGSLDPALDYQEITLDTLRLYPCVCLSMGSQVTFKNDNKPKLYTTIEKREEDPWRWALTNDRKASTIQISKDGLMATRSSADSRNPSVFCAYPLTKANPHYRVQITKLGHWIGIGVADSNFVIQDSVVLGSQQGSINSSYFCQNTCKIRMFDEEMKDVARVYVNDIMDVMVDFENDNIFYWLNEKLQGHISCKNHHLMEGELYPLVNLSSSTEVMLRVMDKPTLYIPIERPKESKKSLVLTAKGGSLQDLRYVMRRVSSGVIQEAKNDMLFAALQGYKSKLKERIYHEVPPETRLLILLAHAFDKDSYFYCLPRELLWLIFELGAVQYQHFEIIKHLVIKEQANVDEIKVNSCQYYPFTIACEIGNIDLLKLLIAHGASIDDMRGQKAIYGAVSGLKTAISDRDHGRIKRFVTEIFFLIQENNIKPDYEVLVAAAQSGDIKLVQFLVEDHGINPKSAENCFSPLMAAAKEGDKNMVEYLLEHGAGDSIVSRYNQKTARDWAKSSNHLELVRILKRQEEKRSKLGKVKQFFNFRKS